MTAEHLDAIRARLAERERMNARYKELIDARQFTTEARILDDSRTLTDSESIKMITTLLDALDTANAAVQWSEPDREAIKRLHELVKARGESIDVWGRSVLIWAADTIERQNARIAALENLCIALYDGTDEYWVTLPENQPTIDDVKAIIIQRRAALKGGDNEE